MSDYGNSAIRFAKQAWGSLGGVQRMAKSSVDANSSQMKTKTAGINLSSANDFDIQLKTKDGGTVYTRPDRMDELKSAARTAKKAQDTFGGYEPIEVVKGGQVVGEIDPAEILSK